MKTKFMRRTAVIVLTIALLTTTVLCGTMAKYTTSVTAGDKARVAYWGFTEKDLVPGEGAEPTDTWTLDLFDGKYTDVVSQDEANVIAPGTYKTTTKGFAYTSNNNNGGTAITAPEVDYKFTVTFETKGTYTDLDANENFVWLVILPGEEEATPYATVAELKAAIESFSGDYKAGNLPKSNAEDHEGAEFSVGANEFTIGWKWNFSSDADGDAADTLMGNAAALENVEFTFTILAEQVDTTPIPTLPFTVKETA